MRVVLSLAFVFTSASFVLAACSDSTETEDQATSSSSSSSSGEPLLRPDAAGAPEDSGASSGGPELQGCEVLVDQSQLEGVQGDERTQPSAVCRDVWIDEIAAGSTGGESIDTACFDCVRHPGFDPAPFVTGCLEERGETGACLDEVGLFQRCITAACDYDCDTSSQRAACFRHAAKDQCSALAAHPSCSGAIDANLGFCNGLSALKLMCGGKPDVGTCSNLVQQGADVTPTAGATVPAFVGGSIAEGTYVATAVQGYGELSNGLQVKSETLRVTGTRLDEVAVNAATQAITAQGGGFQVSGTTLTWKQSCPETATLPFHYTATPTSLVLGFGFGSDTPNDGFVATYTKL